MRSSQCVLVVIALFGVWSAHCAETPLNSLRAQCKANKDPLACIKYRALDAISQAADKSAVKVADGISLIKNSEEPREQTAALSGDLLEAVEEFIEQHDVQLELPKVIGGSTLTVSPRALSDGKLSFTLEDPQDNAVEGKSRRKKNKLKKLIIPLLVFILLKAMTLIPLALGVLGLKAWNALQLSFFSFVTSLALAIFQLCKKVAGESAPVPVAHTAWDPHYYAARNFLVQPNEEDSAAAAAQQLAFSAYTQ